MAHLAWVILGFQAVWFSCAWGVSHGMPLLPISAAVIYLAVFFFFQKNRQQAILFLAKTCLLGMVIDTILSATGLIQFHDAYPKPFEMIQPWWMTILWLCFGASFELSFTWLRNRPYVAFFLGSIFGPVAYYSGTIYEVIYLLQTIGLIALGLGWGLTMILMLRWLAPMLIPLPNISDNGPFPSDQ